MASPSVMKSTRKLRVLAIDVGGSHVKTRVSTRRQIRQFESGPDLTAGQMVKRVQQLTGDWIYDVVSIGYPGVVMHNKVLIEPHHLGGGWVGFDFPRAFGRPTRIMNDAVMQAIGTYEGGRMLFLGLGTGLGSALIIDGIVAPMELAHLPFKKGRAYEYYAGEAGRRRLGANKWSKIVGEIVKRFSTALEADYVVIGGGNARKLRRLPKIARLGNNDFAFIGGFRVWQTAPRTMARRGGNPLIAVI
jgi:polyphosphate glucokinase